MKHGWCARSRVVEGTFISIRGFFSRQQTASVACRQRLSESVHAARFAFLFSAKMTERLEQRYCIKFCQKLGDSQVETIRKVQRVFGDDAMGITHIKEWYNRRWRATLVPVGSQQAEMTSSLTKCGLWSAGPSCHCPRTCRGGGDKLWFGTFHFDQ